MTGTTLSTLAPNLVVNRATDGDEAYFAARRGGITGTEIREWGSVSARRDIIGEKVTGEHDYRSNRYFEHGKHREPFIAEWAQATHGVVHATGLYAHPENPRHLCTPDGYLAGFSMAYEPGERAVTVEIKTTTKDLTPGRLTADRLLIEVDPDSHFAKMKYLRQIQWQMYVMNAAACLFIWEPFTASHIDPESGHFEVTGSPEWCFIERDQEFIDALVAEADEALAQIDAARLAVIGGMPPVADIPADEAMLLADLFAARDALALAEAARVKAWDALQALYESRGEFSEDKGFALVTRSVPKAGRKKVFDEAASRAKAPAHWRAHDAMVARNTHVIETEPGKPRLTITDQR